MTILDAHSLLVCPWCHGPLIFKPVGAICQSCTKTYARHPDGFLDMRVDDSRYEDWLSTNEEARSQWLNECAPLETAGAQHMVQNYLIPLFRRLGLANSAMVLSVGCGGGWDVEILHREGFLAWGIDNGGRVMVWKDRSCVDFLSMSDALLLPFPDSTFDFVFSEGVIEHIGYTGDSPHQQPDWQFRRQRFAESLLRVTKPGGYILVACPNRLFPIDFFHGGRPFHGLTVRFHSPFETFLLSYGDIRRLFEGQAQWVRSLSLKHFFNLRRLAVGNRFMALVTALMECACDLIPDVFWGTAFSPYLVILIRKRSAV